MFRSAQHDYDWKNEIIQQILILRVLKKGWRDLPGMVFLSKAKELRCFAPLNMTTTGRMILFNILSF
jgi:hypothetical protein